MAQRRVAAWVAVCAAVSLASGIGAGSAAAQAARASQLATVSQVIAGARIDISYRRPVARGRDLFGALVPWGRVWSPSSDTAAVVVVSAPIHVEGKALAAGTYSLWAIPDSTVWTIIFSSAHPTFHLRYDGRDDVLSVKATPRMAEHMETLAFYFPMVDADSAELVVHWGKTAVPMKILAR
jgi:hypothetical protein